MLVLGVLAVGGEYGWGTWKTVLTQGPSRLTVYGGKLFAPGRGDVHSVLTIFVTGALVSALIALSRRASVAFVGFPVHGPRRRDG